MSLEAGFWALRLEVRGGGLEEEKEKEKEKKEKEKVPLCESIGHWSLRGRCPKLKKNGYTAKPVDPVMCSWAGAMLRLLDHLSRSSKVKE